MAVYLRKKPLQPDRVRSSSRGDASSSNAAPAIARITSPDPVLFDGNEHILLVCNGADSCRQKGHVLEKVTGVLASLSGKPVKAQIEYCPTCRKYYISTSSFEKCRNANGPLLGNYKFPQASQAMNGRFASLAAESILALYGYSVKKAADLKAGQRRLILASLMDRRLVDQPYVIRHLEFNIKNHGKRKEMRAAVDKWTDDLRWAKSYSIDPKRRFLIDTYRSFSCQPR